jgi:hypothetical protein
MSDTSITLPDVVTTAKAPSPPTVTTLQSPYAVRKIDLTFRLGTGNFGLAGQNVLTVTGLRVYAHLEGVISPHMASTAYIRVYGLSLDHINALSVAGLVYRGRPGNTVQVRAGDDASGMTTIYDGFVYEASPKFNGRADDKHFQVVATGISPTAQLKPVPPSSYPGSVPASQVLQTLAQSIGYTLRNDGVTAVLASPYLPGTALQQIQAVIKAADCAAYLDNINKVLIVWPKDTVAPDATVVVSPQTGMIGYPEFELAQITVRTEFNPTVNQSPGTTVLVRSQLKAADNAKFRVYKVVHDLASQMPDGPWETTLVGTPPQT